MLIFVLVNRIVIGLHALIGVVPTKKELKKRKAQAESEAEAGALVEAVTKFTVSAFK